jgi:flagellar protein FlaF
MGFGSVIATAMSVVVLLAAGFALASGITHSADSTGAALKDAADRELRQMHTTLAISNLTGSKSGGNLTFNLDNVGTEKIDNISRIDVIVKFPGTSESRWFPYLFNGVAPDYYWTYVNITSLAPGIGDAVNPGMLDPGETMLVKVQNLTSFPGNSVWVQATAPNGVSASLVWIIGN